MPTWPLTPQPNVRDIRGHLARQDIIWVARGSVANLLALWALRGVNDVMCECWQSDVVLMGVSAGSVCWFARGTTDSFGLPLRPVTNGLGFLPYSNSPHHDAERNGCPHSPPLVRQELPDCYATGNGAALVFTDMELAEAVCDKEGASARQLRRRPDGTVEEIALPTRLPL